MLGSVTCRQGRWGNLSFILYLSRKYLATVHSTVCPLSSWGRAAVRDSQDSVMVRSEDRNIDSYSQSNSQSNSQLQSIKQSVVLLVFPLLTCRGKLCICAGRRVTLQTLYFRRMAPQCVISIFRPRISLVNLTLMLSVSGFRWSLISLMSSTSHMKSMAGWAL